MAKRNVDIMVKARDQASKKFKKIGGSAVNMGSMIKKAAAMAAVYFSGRAIKRFMGESLELFGRQEQAVVGLGAALKMLGKEAELQAMREFAAQIQEVTEYGDEGTLELMALGAAMGRLSGTELQGATKAAIGLSKAFGLELVGAMRLVSRAAVGDTTMLKRYGIVIDQNLSTTEKFNEVVKIGASNFGLAEAAADTYAGRVQQMKNAIGDLKEQIGSALSPVVKASAERMRDWAVNNQDRIRIFVQKSIAHLTYIKDVFMDLVEYLKTDWRDAAKWAFDSFVTLLRAAFDDAAMLAIDGGQAIANGIKAGMAGIFEKLVAPSAADIEHRAWDRIKADTEAGFRSGVVSPQELAQAKAEIMAAVQASKEQRKARRLAKVTEGLFENVGESVRVAWADAAQNMPAGLRDVFRESLAKRDAALAAIAAGGGGGGGGGAGLAGGPGGPGGVLAGARRRGGVAAVSMRGLTRAPGRGIDPVVRAVEKQRKVSEKQREMLLRNAERREALLERIAASQEGRAATAGASVSG